MLNEIYHRHSIRKFTDQKIPLETINVLLKSAMQAPTARNSQCWRFIVIDECEVLNDMTTLSPYMQMGKTATAAILVMGDRQATSDDAYIYVDCAAAIENILLEAVHLNIGACWCGIAPQKERIDLFRKYFSIDEQYLPVGLVMLGYNDQNPSFIDRFDEAKITYFKKGVTYERK